jgi:hypothetical protein
MAVVGWRCIMVSFYLACMLVYSSLRSYAGWHWAAPRIMYYFHERAALLEWEAQVCLMSQRIPASAGLLLRERERERKNVIINLLSRRTFFVHKGT